MLGPSTAWYLGVAAFLFGIGALGVLVRRNPLIVLLSLEIMLNGANLSLIAFSRHHGHGDGQIFALAVMGPGTAWYLGVAGFLFGVGALGVLIRRNPLIVLLSLEIMLNGGNLALIAFARHLNNGDGQIFALTVMAVAASEVVVGLGLIVALNRKRIPLDVDRLSSLRG